MAAAADLLLRAQSSGIASSVAGLTQMRNALNGLQGPLANVQRSGAAASGGLGGLLGMAGGVTAGLGIYNLLSQGASAAAGAIVGTNDSLEQATISFTTMLGSGQAAQAFLAQLATFAQKTPFEFPDLVTASRRMMAFGFSSGEVIPLLTAVGNAAAGLGGGAATVDRITTALGQMRGKGNVATQEMNQLIEAGVPAWEALAQAIGTDVSTAMARVEARTIPATVMLKAFQDYAGRRFGGMMEAQSRTFTGAVSNIADSLNMGIARGFRPFFDVLRDGAVRFADFLMSADFSAFMSGLSRMSSAVVNFGQQIATGLTATGGIGDRLAGMVGFESMADLARSASDTIISAIGGIIDLLATLGPSLAGAGQALTTFWQTNGAAIISTIQTTWNAIATYYTTVVTAIVSIVKIALDIIRGDWGAVGTDVLGLARVLWTGVVNIFAAGVTATINLIRMLFKAVGIDFAAGLTDQIETARSWAVGLTAGLGEAGTGVQAAADKTQSGADQFRAAVAGIFAVSPSAIPTPTASPVAAGTAAAADTSAKAIDRLKTSLDAAKESASEAKNSLSAAKSELDRYVSAPLIGETALANQMGATSLRIAELEGQKAQKQLDRLARRGPPRSIDAELKRLRLQQQIEGSASAGYAEMHRQLNALAKSQDEMTFGAAAAGIRASRAAVEGLTAEVALRERNVKQLEAEVKQKETLAKGGAATVTSVPRELAAMIAAGVSVAGATTVTAEGALPFGMIPGPGTTVPVVGLTAATIAGLAGGTTGPAPAPTGPISIQITITGNTIASPEDAEALAQRAGAAVLAALQAATGTTANTAPATVPGARRRESGQG